VSLASIADDTLRIIDAGAYQSEAGRRVDIAAAVRRAIEGTRLYRPEELTRLVEQAAPGAQATRIEVTGESTTGAGLRMAHEGATNVVVLNFASARRPGGGFLGGARAQEEELCRGSALYRCLETQPAYYQANRNQRSAVYTDHLIYSPAVPFFRDDARRLLDTPTRLSVITSPAPNTGAVQQNTPHELPLLREAFHRRAQHILAVAAAQGHANLVLGAWGCGAFRGDPELAADAFARGLDGPFHGRFERITFAILVKREADSPNLTAFRQRFGA
jgi:uncharacterized protein (TIGR02452 family)